MQYAVYILALGLAPCASASVIEFTDRSEWDAAVGRYTTIDITNGPDFGFILDDYAEEGVTFSQFAHYFNSGIFLNDGWGMVSSGGAWVTFDTPQLWLAFDNPGSIQVELYRNGKLLYTSSILGGSGTGFFGGLVSTELFDEIYLFRYNQTAVHVDDLYFGVPTPGTLALLAVAGLLGPRRRRVGG